VKLRSFLVGFFSFCFFGLVLEPIHIQFPETSSHRSVQSPATAELNDDVVQAAFTPNIASRTAFSGVAPLHSSMPALESQIKALMARYSYLQAGMFFLDLDNGNYLDIRGDRIFPAASTIKLPILVAFFQDVDAGKVSLTEKLVLRRDLITNGSGTMQYARVGKKFTALETVNKMITISDNTATNMIIARLGGIAQLNKRFQRWGLHNTVIHHLLADLRGTNTTSAKDMTRVLALLVNHKLVSLQSRATILDILSRTTIRTLLPAGLGPGATIANKTGDIGFVIGDAGLITMPSGKRYIAAVFVRRPYQDLRGRLFVRQISHLAYSYLSQPFPSDFYNNALRGTSARRALLAKRQRYQQQKARRPGRRLILSEN